jgi:hypothetical protein
MLTLHEQQKKLYINYACKIMENNYILAANLCKKP